MDVDIPQNEEAMETDSPINIEHQHPQLTRKDSIIDPDGDEVMQGDEDEEVYEEEDIVIGDGQEEGGEEIEAEEEYVEGEGDYDVDLEGGDDQGIGETQEESLDTEEGVVAVDTGATSTAEDLPSATQDDTSAPVQDAETTTSLDQQLSGETGVETAPVAADVTGKSQEETSQEVTETKVEDAAEVEHTENGPVKGEHENGHVVDDEEEDGEHGEEQDVDDEEEEGEERYDLLTPETLPPIILNLPNARIALFNAIPTEPELPLWFSDRIGELCEDTLDRVWCAIRFEVDCMGRPNEDDEMVVTEKLMDLKMGDSDVNLEDVTFLELVQMYHDCELPHPMELHLEFQPHRFITRFNAIQKELEAREVIYIEDDEEGEEEEGIQEGAHVHEDQHAQEGEVEGEHETGKTDTHQLAVPLPPLETGQSDTEKQAPAEEPAPDKVETEQVVDAEPAKTESEVRPAEALPPTADELALAKAGKPVDKSLHLDQAKLQEEPLIEAETPITASANVAQSAPEPPVEGNKVTVPNTDPIPQPAGVPEITENQEAPVTTAEEAEAATIPDEDRVGTDLDTTEGQAQAQPIAGEAAVYGPAGDEDDDLIEGGEEYEEGDYDDELDPDGEVQGETEGQDLLGEAGGLADAVGEEEAEGGGEAEVEGEDGDPYGVDGFVNGLDGDAADEGDVVEEEEYEEYEDEADPEEGAEGEVYETETEPAPEVEADATVNAEESNGGHVIDADEELGIQRDDDELIEDGEGEDGTAGVAAEAEVEEPEAVAEKAEGEISPSLIKRGRSADLEEGGEEVVGKKVKIDEVE